MVQLMAESTLLVRGKLCCRQTPRDWPSRGLWVCGCPFALSLWSRSGAGRVRGWLCQCPAPPAPQGQMGGAEGMHGPPSRRHIGPTLPSAGLVAEPWATSALESPPLSCPIYYLLCHPSWWRFLSSSCTPKPIKLDNSLFKWKKVCSVVYWVFLNIGREVLRILFSTYFIFTIYFKVNAVGTFLMGTLSPVVWNLGSPVNLSLGKLYWICVHPAWTWDADAAGKAHGIRCQCVLLAPCWESHCPWHAAGPCPPSSSSWECPKTLWSSPLASSCSSCLSSASWHMPDHLLLVMDWGEASRCLGRQLLWLRWGRQASPLCRPCFACTCPWML